MIAIRMQEPDLDLSGSFLSLIHKTQSHEKKKGLILNLFL